MSDNGFWSDPKTGPANRQWKPGEKRSYIPVISFRADEPTPGGVVGKITSMEGTQQERAVIPGGRGGGTKKP